LQAARDESLWSTAGEGAARAVRARRERRGTEAMNMVEADGLVGKERSEWVGCGKRRRKLKRKLERKTRLRRKEMHERGLL
jgi:hypothetical protein